MPPRARTTVVWSLAIVANAAMAVWLFTLFTRPAADHWPAVRRARAALADNRPQQAFQAVSHIRDTKPGAAEGLAVAATALLRMGHVAAARRTLQRALMLNPDQPDALKTLAAIDLAGGDGQSGLHLLKRAAKLDPADFRPWYAMGKVHHDLGDLHASSSAYSKALALQPPRAEKRASQVGLTRALIDLNDDQRAAAALAPALAETPRDPELLTLDARLAWLRGDTDRALASAKRALEQTPDDFDALLVRAQVMNSRGALEIALADLAHASKLNRNHLGALQLLAQVQTRLGRAEDAAYTQTRLTEARDRVAEMDKLTREISARPDDPTPRYRMGRVALESGINTLALQCFRAALDLDPSFGPAREALESMRSQERANSTHGSGSALP